jgi:hypothetical protein
MLNQPMAAVFTAQAAIVFIVFFVLVLMCLHGSRYFQRSQTIDQALAFVGESIYELLDHSVIAIECQLDRTQQRIDLRNSVAPSWTALSDFCPDLGQQFIN